jgi:hypothetical protein
MPYLREAAMWEKLKNFIIPHLIGLLFIFAGWYLSILNVGLTRFQENVLFTKTTFTGLVLIVIGAYIPGIWKKISGK